MLKSILVGVAGLVLYACGGQAPQQQLVFGDLPPISTRDSGAIVIQVDKIAGEIDISDSQQCNITFLELSSEGRNYVADITQLRLHNDRIYILDRNSEQLFIYDRQGKCLKKIDARGKGPQEYLGLLTMTIDSNRLWVQDRLAPQMLVYNLDGEFQKKLPRPVNVSDWARFDGKMISYYHPQQNEHTDLGTTSFCVGTEREVLYAGFYHHPLQQTSFGLQTFLPSWDPQQVLFKPQWTDSVYQFINDSTCAVKYIINQPHSIWENRDQKMSLSEIRNAIHDGQYTTLDRLSEGRDQVVVEIVETGEKRGSYLYDKQRGLLYKIKDNYPITGWLQAVEGNQFLGFLGPDNFRYLYERHQSGEQRISNPKLLQLASEVGEDSNPVLVFFNFNLPNP